MFICWFILGKGHDKKIPEWVLNEDFVKSFHDRQKQTVSEMKDLIFIKLIHTIHFQFTELIVSVFRIVVWIRHIGSTFIVIYNKSSMDKTVDSLVLRRCTVYFLYLMETKMTIFFWGCVGNIKKKSGNLWCIYWRSCILQ